MHWKRFAQAFVLGAGISLVGAGCSAVDALVSSSAGQRAGARSPERLLAIGRVFENQGHLAKASAMYRQALKSDPKNQVARQRLQFIADINSGKSLAPSDLLSRRAIAAADTLTTGGRTKTKRPTRKTTFVAEKPTALKDALDSSSVVASLKPDTNLDLTPTVIEPTLMQRELELNDVAAEEVAGTIEIVDTGWELAEYETDSDFGKSDSGSVAITTDGIVDIETVSFDGEMNLVDGVTNAIATEESNQWVPVRRTQVTLEETMRYMQAPEDHVLDLLGSLRNGEHEGVQALAATVLAECERHQGRVNDALADACGTPSELLQVAARDALVQRNVVDDSSIEHLMVLLASEDADVRSQAATCLRNFNNTQWADACVTGLSDLLFDEKPQVIALAAATLGDFGSSAASHARTLAELSSSDDDLIRQASTIALQRIQ